MYNRHNLQPHIFRLLGVLALEGWREAWRP